MTEFPFSMLLVFVRFQSPKVQAHKHLGPGLTTFLYSFNTFNKVIIHRITILIFPLNFLCILEKLRKPKRARRQQWKCSATPSLSIQ